MNKAAVLLLCELSTIKVDAPTSRRNVKIVHPTKLSIRCPGQYDDDALILWRAILFD